MIFQVFESWWPMSMWTVKRKIWRIEFVRYKCSSIWSSLNMSSLTSISCQQLHVNIEKGDYWKYAMMYTEKSDLVWSSLLEVRKPKAYIESWPKIVVIEVEALACHKHRLAENDLRKICWLLFFFFSLSEEDYSYA